ncbi:protein FAM110D [Ambystoma mexicanum]|uniref:protein FAM110D n=1 Tax=Ambystoma mexicanum TaxID=8296 RepID=UPI0037E76FE1
MVTMLRPAPLAGSSSPLGLMNRGPEYLRRQLDGGTGARSPSAVERLEADKAKYVKTQQVIDSRQDPALATTPSCARKLLSPWSEPGPHGVANPSKTTSSRLGSVVRRSSGRRLMRPDSLVMYRQQRDCKAVNKENANGFSLVRRLFQSPMRERHGDSIASAAVPGTPFPWILMEKGEARAPSSPCNSPSSRRLAVPCLGLNLATPRSPALARQSPRSGGHCPRSPRECHSSKSPHCKGLSPLPEALEGSRCVLLPQKPLSPSEEDRFFEACGLDELALTKDRVSPPGALLELSSVSSWESRHSGHSHSSSLDESSSAEKGSRGQARSPVSVIERNARVIRWLYSCQKARITKCESTKCEPAKFESTKLESTV